MDAFVDEVNRRLETADVLTLAAYCLWRLNHIHPFINGNGRTARGCVTTSSASSSAVGFRALPYCPN